jgi:hypothetical protein
MGQQQTVPADTEVVEAQLVGYWDDVVTITGSALAGMVSRKIRRLLK